MLWTMWHHLHLPPPQHTPCSSGTLHILSLSLACSSHPSHLANSCSSFMSQLFILLANLPYLSPSLSLLPWILGLHPNLALYWNNLWALPPRESGQSYHEEILLCMLDLQEIGQCFPNFTNGPNDMEGLIKADCWAQHVISDSSYHVPKNECF